LKKDFDVRTNDEKYFETVKKWYGKIYEQVKDFIANPDDEKTRENPIIGVQIENEYGHCGGLYEKEGGEAHMQRLQKIAIDTGFKVALYTARVALQSIPVFFLRKSEHVVLSLPFVFVLIPCEIREVDNPCEVEFVGRIVEIQILAQLLSHCSQSDTGCLPFFIAYKEEKVVLFGAKLATDFRLFSGEEF